MFYTTVVRIEELHQETDMNSLTILLILIETPALVTAINQYTNYSGGKGPSFMGKSYTK
jgi:hypothetical protein